MLNLEKNGIWGVFIAAIALLLSACNPLSPVKLKPVSEYTITNTQSVLIPKHSKTRLTLLISQMVASSGYQSPGMVYVEVPYKLKMYANHRWVAPPAEMLMVLLAQQLRATGYFHAVVTPPFSGVANYRLDTQLLALQQEFLQPVSSIRLVMRVSLVSSSSNRVVASRRFQVRVSAPKNNPYDGVLATNKAARILCQRIAKFVAHKR